MGMGGATQESESTSYGYLPYTSPLNASIIGQYQASAADQAASLAKEQLNAAMANITKNFTDSRVALQPYSQQGVQATNKLNQYLGLDPYNPGTKAPTAPTDPNTWNPSMKNLQDYVGQNLVAQDQANGKSGVYYTGAGASPDGWSVTPSRDFLGHVTSTDPSGMMWAATGTPGNPLNKNAAIHNVLSSSASSAIGDQLKQDYIANNTEQYKADTSQYNLDMQNYQQNLDWYNKYKAEGPKTQQQITEEVTNQPGYQAQQQEGINSIQKAASARGLLGSGNMLKDLISFSGNLEGQYYQNMLQNLQQQAAVGANAAGANSQSYQQQGGALANLRSSLADSLGNASLAKGNALAQAYQLGNTSYNKVVTGESSSKSSSGGGLSGIGSILGSVASFAKMSSKTFKTEGRDPEISLDKLDNLPVEKWFYKPEVANTINDKVEHIGPYAEDFKKAFNIGNGKTIDMMDAVGVLFDIVKQLKDKIAVLEAK